MGDSSEYTFEPEKLPKLAEINRKTQSEIHHHSKDRKQRHRKMEIDDDDDNSEPPTNDELLIDAADEGDLESVRELLEDGQDRANVNYASADDPEATALHWASRNGHLDVVKLLEAKGANVNARDNTGEKSIALGLWNSMEPSFVVDRPISD